jgi:uncharacterized protein YbjT (DUF2867 family)
MIIIIILFQQAYILFTLYHNIIIIVYRLIEINCAYIFDSSASRHFVKNFDHSQHPPRRLNSSAKEYDNEHRTTSTTMASEGNPINSNNNNRIGHDDETAGMLWERTAGYPSMSMQRKIERMTLSERLPGFLQTVGLTMFVCFLLVTGNQYYYDDNNSNSNNNNNERFEGNANVANANANAGLTEFEGNNVGTIFERNNGGTVLVTGATGRLGALLYKELKKKGATVRAFVRDAEKARTVLGCSACDEREGIYVGDVTHPEDLQNAMADGSVTTLAVAIGAGYKDPPEVVKAVEFDSVVSSVRALGLSAARGATKGGDHNNLRVVFCSSMGTEQSPPPKWGGPILHWKLNAETFLATSGISTTIVKPCGLPEHMAGKNSTLLVGHHGAIMEGSDYHTVSREDVASVMAEAAVGLSNSKSRCLNLRFDLCSKPGPPTTDLEALIESARWEWDQPK